MKKLLLLMPLLTACGFEIVDTGYRGIKTSFGKIQGEPLPEGLHFYNPFTADIREIEVRELKFEDSTQAFTRDTQTVTIAYAVTYYPDPTKVHVMYKQFGTEWAEKLLRPAVLGSLKDAIGQYVADDIIAKRAQATKAAEKELKDNLKTRDIIVTRLDFTNVDFDDAYEKAVEQKVVAIQKAAEAKNKTVEIEEQAKQTVLSAKADAEAMRIKSQALSQNKNLVEYEKALKWDGKLPTHIMGAAVPFMNIKGGE